MRRIGILLILLLAVAHAKVVSNSILRVSSDDITHCFPSGYCETIINVTYLEDPPQTRTIPLNALSNAFNPEAHLIGSVEFYNLTSYTITEYTSSEAQVSGTYTTTISAMDLTTTITELNISRVTVSENVTTYTWTADTPNQIRLTTDDSTLLLMRYNITAGSQVEWNLSFAAPFGIILDPTTVSGCSDVDTEDVYTLNTDIEGNKSDGACLSVKSSNVLLDCDGYSITGNTTFGDAGPVGGTGPWGIYFDSSSPPSNVTIRDCIVGNYTTAIEIAQGGANITLENLTVYNNTAEGVRMQGTNITLNTSRLYENFAADIVMMDCIDCLVHGIVTNSSVAILSSLAIDISNTSNLTVRDNILANPDQIGIMVRAAVYNGTFLNNTIYGGNYGFYVKDQGDIGVNASENLTFRNNTIFNTTYAFYVLFGNHSNYSSNIIYNTSYALFFNHSHNVTIQENNISNNSQVGIYIMESYDENRIFSNIIYNHSQERATGIFLERMSSLINVYDNTIDNNTYGIYINHTNITNITNNNLSSNSYGIRFESSQDNNLSLNNISSSTLTSFHFNHSNATFTDTNHISSLVDGSNMINVTNESIVTALVGSTYNTIVTEALNFSFTNATNVTFQNTTADLSTAGVIAIACQSTTTTCYAMSNILTITNNSGSANLTQLLIYYNISRIDDAHYSASDLQIARYNISGGWTSLGSSAVASGYIRYGHIDVFSPFASVAFESATTGSSDTTTTTEEDKDLGLSYEVSGSIVDVTAASGSSGVAEVTVRLIYLDTGVPVGSDQTTDSSGQAIFTITESGEYKLTDVSRPSGYANAADLAFEVTLNGEEEETVVTPIELPPEEEVPPEEVPPEEPPEEPSPEEVPPEEVPPEEPAEQPPPVEEPEAPPEKPVVTEEGLDTGLLVLIIIAVVAIVVAGWYFLGRGQK